MGKFYNEEINDVITGLNTDLTTGLTGDEVKKRLDQYGYNQLEGKRKKSFLSMFFAQFKSFMIIILLIAAVISGVVGIYHR